MPQLRTLRRSSEGKIIAGVCAGIAQWLGWDATMVRVIFVVGSFLPILPGFVVYLLLWAIIPLREKHQGEPD